MYSWSCTIVLGVLAVFAHFTMDYPQEKSLRDQKEEIGKFSMKFSHLEEILAILGSLGITIFFVPVACTILMDIFFFVSTMKIINRMHTYGRIHHKLRHR